MQPEACVTRQAAVKKKSLHSDSFIHILPLSSRVVTVYSVAAFVIDAIISLNNSGNGVKKNIEVSAHMYRVSSESFMQIS